MFGPFDQPPLLQRCTLFVLDAETGKPKKKPISTPPETMTSPLGSRVSAGARRLPPMLDVLDHAPVAGS